MSHGEEAPYGMTGSPPGKVLVALDGSQAAARALMVATALARQLGAIVEVLYVSPNPILEADVRRKLALDTGEMADVRIAIRVGDPANEIHTAAAQIDTMLLVMAARGANSASALASVPLSVLVETNRPVVLVRSDLLSEGRLASQSVKRLLVPVDGTPTTARALRPAAELAQRLGASIDLLYVAEPDGEPGEPGSITAPRYVDQPQHEWPHWTAEAINRLLSVLARCPEGVPADLYLAIGEPGAEIARFASEHDEDAIVLVRRSQLEAGHGQVLWHVFGSSTIPIVFVVTPDPRELTPASSRGSGIGGTE